MIGEYKAHVGPGILAVIIGDVEYVFTAGDVGETVIIDGIEHGVIDSFLTQEQLVRMAESLQ